MSPLVLIAKQFARPRSLRLGGTLPLVDSSPNNSKCWWARKRHTNALSARQWNSWTRAFIWAAPRLPAGKNYMNGRTFVDTNVLIYAHDVDSTPKHTIAKNILRELWSERTGVLSLQVLQEFYVNVTRKIRSPLPNEIGRASCRERGVDLGGRGRSAGKKQRR